MAKQDPHAYARNMILNMGPKAAYRICNYYSAEFIGSEKNALNPCSKFYLHARNIVKKLYPNADKEE